MSTAETKQKLHQYALWFDHHRRSITDPEKKMEFCMRALDQIVDIQAYLWRDIFDLERRNASPTALSDAGVWLPTHLRHDEAITRMRENGSDTP